MAKPEHMPKLVPQYADAIESGIAVERGVNQHDAPLGWIVGEKGCRDEPPARVVIHNREDRPAEARGRIGIELRQVFKLDPACRHPCLGRTTYAFARQLIFLRRRKTLLR